MPPPTNVVRDQTPVVTPVVEHPGDITLPKKSWRDRVPPDLAKELEALRRYDPAIRGALQDPRTNQLFLTDPTKVLDDLKIEISPKLREVLRGRNGLDRMTASHHLRLPGNPVITPAVNVRIDDQPKAPTWPLSAGKTVLYDLNPLAYLFKPSGQLDHGFPVVYEITAACIRDLEAQWFDRGPLADIVTNLISKVTDPTLVAAINLVDLAASEFDLDLGLGMPAGMSTTCQDVLTITIHVPSAATPASSGGPSVSLFLRIAASVVVDHSDPGTEQFYLHLANSMADCEATLTFANLPIVGTQVVNLSAELSQFLKAQYPRIKVFFDVPVDRSGKSDLTPKQIDLKIIDDTSSADGDALALLLSFGDMGPGDRTAFTQSFINSGSGLVIDFNWLRARILPSIEQALSLPTPIDRATGVWTGQAPIAGGDGAVLTCLALGVLWGTRDITVLAGVSKSGDCYTAYASMSATMSVAVDHGDLVFNPPQFSTPTVEVDIPWYCYLLSIVVGGILGGVIFGALGTLVGAVVAPVLLHNIQGIAEGTVESVVTAVNSGIQSQTAGVQQIDLGSLKLALQYVSLDDLMALHNVEVADSLPALSEGIAFIPDGGYLDLVSGQVAPIQAGSGHLIWTGSGSSRALVGVGGTGLTLVGDRDPASVTRYQLYHDYYVTGQRLSAGQLDAGSEVHHPPYGLVYAARTGDGHYARFTVTNVYGDGIGLRYKTYPLKTKQQPVVPTLDVTGSFSPVRVHKLDPKPKPAFQSLSGKVAGKWGTWFDANVDWWDQGTFVANWVDFKTPISLSWTVQGQSLAGKTGSIATNGTQIQYELSGSQVDLIVYPIVTMDVEIIATVRDANGQQATATLTVPTVPGGFLRLVGGDGGATIPHGVAPPLGDYLVAYQKHVGPWTEVDPRSVADQGYRVNQPAPRVGPETPG